ncbi:hypothetical protein JCM8097_001369 [Rhodosporidiobolus ruineniae]
MSTFSFGAPKPAAPTFSFGQPAASAAPATGTTPSLFGSTPAAPASAAPTTSLFGAPAASAAPATGGLFGAAPAASAAPATGGLFGAAPAASAAPATGGLFGAAPAAGGTSLFGAPKPAGTGLFGSTTTPAASQPGAAPSLFGSTQPAAAGTGLFGSAAPAPAAGGGLFGAAAPAASGTGTSLFGQPAAPAAGGGLFGSTAAAPAAQPAVTAAPLFGQSQSAASSSLFGPKPTAPAPTAQPSLFGASTAFALGASTSIVPAPPSLPKLGDPLPSSLSSSSEKPIEARIEAIKAAWDPSNPACRFQTYFYNEIPPGQSASMFAKPPQASEQGWEKARRENPDPERLVPALALGFSSLQSRLASQSRQSASHAALLTQIHEHLSTLASEHSLTTSLRLLRAQQNAVALHARLTALVAKSAALSPARNSSVRREEDELRVELEALRPEVERVKSRGNELWAGVGALKARRREEEGTEWAVADEEGLRQILEILTSHQSGLDHLTRLLVAMGRDVDVVAEAFGAPKVKVGGGVLGQGEEGR